MGKVTKLYFKWKPGMGNLKLRLGDSKEDLLSQDILRAIDDNNTKAFTGKDGTPWRTEFYKGKVSKIWLNRNSSFKIENTEILRQHYREVQPLLERNFERLNLDDDGDFDIKSYTETAVFYVVCMDFLVVMIGIIEQSVQNNGRYYL